MNPAATTARPPSASKVAAEGNTDPMAVRSPLQTLSPKPGLMLAMDLKLDAYAVGAEGLRLSMPGEHLALSIVVGPTSGLGGSFALVPDRLTLEKVTVTEVLLTEAEVRLPAAGLVLRGPAKVAGVSAQGALPLAPVLSPLAFTGNAEIAEAEAHELGFAVQDVAGLGTIEGRFSLASSGLSYEGTVSSGHRLHRLQVQSLCLRAVTASLGERRVRVGRVRLEGVEAAADEETLSFRCRQLELERVSVDGPEGRFEIDRIELPRGAELVDGSLRADVITLGRLQANAAKMRLASAAASPGEARPFALPILPDLPFLDFVQGDFQVGVTVDLTLPVIKSKVTTQSLQISIQDGSIDFKRLERSLGSVLDTVLDFEVVKDELIFEIDPIPGVSFDNITLVSWPLTTPDDRTLARQCRVRLRKLLDYHVNPWVLEQAGLTTGAKATKGDGAIALRRVEVEDLSIQAKVGGPSTTALAPYGEVTLGSEEGLAVGRFDLQGCVCFSPGVTREPTELGLTVEAVRLGQSHVQALGLTVGFEALELQSLALGTLLAGLVPDSAKVDLAGLTLAGSTIGGLPKSLAALVIHLPL